MGQLLNRNMISEDPALKDLDVGYFERGSQRDQFKIGVLCVISEFNSDATLNINSHYTVLELFNIVKEALQENDRYSKEEAETYAACMVYLIADEIGAGRTGNNFKPLKDIVCKKSYQAVMNRLRKSQYFHLAQLLIKICQKFTNEDADFQQFSDCFVIVNDSNSEIRVAAESIEEKFLKLLSNKYLSIEKVDILNKACYKMKESKPVLADLYNQFLEQGGSRSKSAHTHKIKPWKILLPILALFSILLLGSGIPLFITAQIAFTQNTLNSLFYATENITQVLGTFDSQYVSQITVSEDLKDGDETHTTNIYLVRQEDLLKHNRTVTFQSPPNIQHSDQFRTSGLVREKYLLDQSTIFYEIFIAVSVGENPTGRLFVFDDFNSFSDYCMDLTDGLSTAVLSQNLNIGTEGLMLPTTLNTVVNKTGYYYIAAETPANITYNFTYAIEQIYLNNQDYDLNCTVSSAKNCSLTILDDGVWYILSYTLVDQGTGSDSTHLRVTTSGVMGWLEVVAIILIIVGFLGSVIFVCLCKLRSRKKRTQPCTC